MTTRAWRPKVRDAWPASAILPGPNSIRAAVAKAKEPGSPGIFGRKVVGEFYGLARFGHHVGDRVAPCLVMDGFLVGSWCVRMTIDLVEDKPVRIVFALEDIETGDARFLNAFLGIGQRSFAKGLDAVGLYMDVNVNDQHGVGGMVPRFWVFVADFL